MLARLLLVAVALAAAAAPCAALGGATDLQGADADCYDRATDAIFLGPCFDATTTSCPDACKAELQSFTVTEACWTALLTDPLVGGLLGTEYL